MTKRMSGFHSLSRRIVIQFCVFTMVLSSVYGGISFILLYTLEDSFIEKSILQEATFLAAGYDQTGIWPNTRSSKMQLHFSKATLPEDMREISISEPMRKEFFGEEGRHYHLYEFADHQGVYLTAEVSEDLMVRPIREGIIQFLAFSAFIVTIIACTIAWLIGRKMTRPLKQLAELVDGVAPEQIPQNFAQQFPNNEIGILAQTLEQTLQRITHALEREKFFTRDVSHELRTPLAVIKNALELHQTQHDFKDADKAILNRVSESAEQMDKTVHILLLLAREEQALAKKEPVNLMSIVEKSVIDNRLLLDGKPVNVVIDDTCQTQVLAQSVMLKVLLDNLLSNAFQYTPAGEVSVAFVDQTLIVSDTGPGIEDIISDKVTQSGVKGSQSAGFGFGLSIVKRLCEQQEWTLSVASENGTRVKVSLG